MTGRLVGEHVLVTGGAQGIGAAIVDVALREQAQVTFIDIDEGRGREREAAGRDRGEPVVFVPGDIRDARSVDQAISQANERQGRAITGLVNNAGRNSYADPVQMTESDWDDTFAVDLKGAWLCARAVLPAMLEAQHGSIVNIASVHASLTQAGMFPYAAAKSGLVGLTRSLALEVAPSQIRVNAVSPGYTMTPLLEDYFANQAPEGELDRVLERHPLGRIATTAEIAEVVCFLLSPAASFVSGADWSVDGAFSARFA